MGKKLQGKRSGHANQSGKATREMTTPLCLEKVVVGIAVWLIMLPALTASGQSVSDTTRPLSVLSYNIHHGEVTDGRLDLERLAAVIKSVDADVVALQEVDQNLPRSGSADQARRLAELTAMRSVFADNISFLGGRYGNAVLSTLPILHAENHPLPRHNRGEQRGMLLTELRFGRQVLRVLATHLDHRSDDTERMASVGFINDFLKQAPQTPTLLAGDLNATRDSRVLELLTEGSSEARHNVGDLAETAAPSAANSGPPPSGDGSYSPVWTIAGRDEQPTSPATHPRRQIDYVLYRPADRWHEMETVVIDEGVASDHRPLLAKLRLSAPPPATVEYGDILQVPVEDGQVSRAEGAQQWRPRRASIRRAMQSIMGYLPPPARRQPPAMTLIEEVDCGSYVRRKVTYESQPGCQTPAYLCVPTASDAAGTAAVKHPAVLCLHPTDNRIGHGVVVGLSDKLNRSYAAELAERGYVTLAPSYPLLANYQPDMEQLGWESGTAKAIWDNMRGVDLLQSLTVVDADAIGAIGHSLGGHNSIYTAVFDERIKVAVASCGFDSYQDYYDGDPSVWKPGKGWTQLRYMPRLADYRGRLHEIPFDFDELLAVMAPRPMLAIAPLRDGNFRAASVDRVTTAARRVYALYGKADQLQVRHPDCAHDFPPAMREEAYRFLDQALR